MSTETCRACGCSVALHFSDGCHRAYGFLCRCPLTRDDLTEAPEVD